MLITFLHAKNSRLRISHEQKLQQLTQLFFWRLLCTHHALGAANPAASASASRPAAPTDAEKGRVTVIKTKGSVDAGCCCCCCCLCCCCFSAGRETLVARMWLIRDVQILPWLSAVTTIATAPPTNGNEAVTEDSFSLKLFYEVQKRYHAR